MRGMEGNEGAGCDLNRSGNGGERRHMAVLMDERGVKDDVESEEAAAPANGGERSLDGKVVKGGFGERKIALRAFLSIGGGNIGPWDFKEVGVVESAFGRRGHKLDDLKDGVLSVREMIFPKGVSVPCLLYRAEEGRRKVGEFVFEKGNDAVGGG